MSECLKVEAVGAVVDRGVVFKDAAMITVDHKVVALVEATTEISFIWYNVIGAVVVIVVGLVLSAGSRSAGTG